MPPSLPPALSWSNWRAGSWTRLPSGVRAGVPTSSGTWRSGLGSSSRLGWLSCSPLTRTPTSGGWRRSDFEGPQPASTPLR
eukprot:3322926-Alexandrium_andersonii.AAC.1